MLLEGLDLKTLVSTTRRQCSEEDMDNAVDHIANLIIDEVVLGICFEVHRSVKTGLLALMEPQDSVSVVGSASSSAASSAASTPILGTDVFGQLITTSVGVPALKKQPECVCPNCQRHLAASRFAPHLEKCMGGRLARNSSRVASQRLASKSKESVSYREGGGGQDDDDDNAEDEDWIEPGRASSAAASRRKRDRNSPKRAKAATARMVRPGGGEVPHDGTITPPAHFEQLSQEDRLHWLSTVCGVLSSSSRKICTRPTRCHIHTDLQRREARIRWLSHHTAPGEEDSHVDIDSFTEGDTAALRESLAQLSSASSPAESTISTCSNPSVTGHYTRKKDKTRNRRQKGSKSASRGSSPSVME